MFIGSSWNIHHPTLGVAPSLGFSRSLLRAAHEDGHVLLLPQHVADEGLGTFKGTWLRAVPTDGAQGMGCWEDTDTGEQRYVPMGPWGALR